MLRYGFTLSQNGERGVGFLTVDSPAKLEVEVSNPGQPLGVQSISFSFAFGPNATNLAPSAGDVVAILPAGWTDQGNFTYAPPAGWKIALDAVRFAFDIRKVNNAPGTTTVGVREVTDSGSGILNPPFSINKLPAWLVLRNLRAKDPLIQPGGTVTLMWTATKGQLYSIVGPGINTTYVPASDNALWQSSSVQTMAPTATFIVSATIQVEGNILTAQANATVQVDVPQIMSFRAPERPVIEGTIPLQWRTSNTDSLKLIANGIATDVPVNSPDPAYAAHPRAPRTDFQLRAKRGTTTIDSTPVTSLVYRWSVLKQVDLGYGRAWQAGFSNDGTRLFVSSEKGRTALDTTDYSTVARVPEYMAIPMAPNVMAVSTDNSVLFMGWTHIMTALAALSVTTMEIIEKWIDARAFVNDADSGTMYIKSQNYLEAYDSSTCELVKRVLLQRMDSRYDMLLSPDGGVIYFHMSRTSRGETGPLRRYDIGAGTITSVLPAYVGPLSIALDAVNLCIVNGADELAEIDGRTGAKVRSVKLRDPKRPTVVPANVVRLERDPGGAGVYALLSFTKDDRTLVLCDPETGKQQHVQKGSGDLSFALNRYGNRIAVTGIESGSKITVLANDKWERVNDVGPVLHNLHPDSNAYAANGERPRPQLLETLTLETKSLALAMAGESRLLAVKHGMDGDVVTNQAIPANVLANLANGAVTRVSAEPSASQPYYATVAYTGGVTAGALMRIDSASGGTEVIVTVPAGPLDLATSHDGKKIYFAAANQLMIFAEP